MSKNLVKRGNVWYFVKTVKGKRISTSLKTEDIHQAKAAASGVILKFKSARRNDWQKKFDSAVVKSDLRKPVLGTRINLLIKSAAEMQHLTGSFIYIFRDQEEIVYIGKTTNLHFRIGDHIRKRRIVFTSVFYFPVDSTEVAEVEAMMIRFHNPKYNSNFVI